MYLNGMLLSASDYVANDGSTVVLVGANAGDAVLINGYEVGLQGPAGEVSTAQLTTALATKADTSHSHTKADVGLSNVDNTSDANKPVSTAQAAAIALKADSSALANKSDVGHGHTALTGLTVTALKETSVAMAANNIDLSLGNHFTKQSVAQQLSQ